MGAPGSICIVTPVAVATFKNRYITGSCLLFPVRPLQTDYSQIFSFGLDRMKGGITRVELRPLVGGFQRQVGAFGMAKVAQLELFGNRGNKVADPLALQSCEWIIGSDVMRAVTICTFGMPRRSRIGFGQHFPRAVKTALVEHRVTIVF